jgi:hypothetical protein
MMTIVHPTTAPSLDAAAVTLINKDSHGIHTRFNPSLLRFPHLKDIGFLKSSDHTEAPLQDSYVRTLKTLNKGANLPFRLFRATGGFPSIVGRNESLALS